MNFLKNLFRENNKSSNESCHPDNGPLAIEDVRSNSKEEGEAILNLWYETDRTTISELRAKAYISVGDDQKKLKFLQSRANTDWKNAQKYPVPEAVKSDVKVVGDATNLDMGKACMHCTLEMMGGYIALFRDVFSKVPKGKYRFESNQVLMCVTGLVRDKNGNLNVQIDNITQL